MLYSGIDTLYKEYYGISKNQLNNKTPSLTYSNINKELKITKGNTMLKNISKTYKKRNMCNNKTRKNKK